jgi:PAS domain S-box-containing protein
MSHTHHSAYVLLSLLVAVLGSWTALDLFRRVRTHVGRARRTWLVTAAVAMGSSIWSMHFIAMLGFDPGLPVRYDVPLTILSLGLAILATGGAFFAAAAGGASRRQVVIAGVFMGSGICLMHYVGMAALRTAVSLSYDYRLVALSFAVAVGASTTALFAARRERSMPWRAAAAVMLGGAIVGMHYTAMAALQMTMGGPTTPAAGGVGVTPLVLAFEVAAGTLVILLLALAASLYDRRLDILGALEASRVGYWELALQNMTLSASTRAKEIYGLAGSAALSYADLLSSIHPEDVARRQALLEQALETRADYDGEYRIIHTDGEVRWVNVRGRVLCDARGRPHRITGIVMDVTDRHRAFAAVAESEGRFRLIADSAPALIWMTDEVGNVTFANRYYETVFGRPSDEMLGAGWAEIVLPEDVKAYRRSFGAAMQARGAFKHFTRGRDRHGRILWFRCEGTPRFAPDGSFAGYTGCNVDVTEAMVAQEQQRLLINELNHRVKNTLATVQSIAAQTARRADSPEDFREKFETRLIALSQTHNALTRGGWESASLSELLGQEFKPYASEQVRLDGPEVDLPPRTAVTLGMVFHELATNAAKYGALSTPAGSVSVSWRTVLASGAAPRLILRWREAGGPPVRTPTRSGFGSRLIEGSVKGELGGVSRMVFDPEGFHCRLEIVLSDAAGGAEDAASAAG